jgi:hypothetical protein
MAFFEKTPNFSPKKILIITSAPVLTFEGFFARVVRRPDPVAFDVVVPVQVDAVALAT